MRTDDPIRASTIKPAPVEWLWRDRVPAGMISLVAGTPGQGKSSFVTHVAADVSHHGEVIFSTLEEPLRQVLRPRLEAAGANLDAVNIWTPFLPRDTGRLVDQIRKLRAKLLVLDPIAAHLDVSIYDNQAVRQALSPLADVAEETNCAVLLVSHTVKSVPKSAHALAAVGGSGGGLAGAARVVYMFGAVNHQRVLACAKTNLGPVPSSLTFQFDVEDISGEVGFLVLTGETTTTARELLDQPASGTGSRTIRLDRACNFLEESLQEGPRPAAEVTAAATAEGIKDITLRRAFEEVGVVTDKPNGGRGAKWSLPPDLSSADEDSSENGALVDATA